MKLTIDWLKEKLACSGGVNWFKNQKATDTVEVLRALANENRLDWANWTIVMVMSRPQYLQYGIFAAEQVLDIFEKKCPNDLRPRNAIEAPRKVWENDTIENRTAAYDSAEAASSSAHDSFSSAEAAAELLDAASSDAYDAASSSADAASSSAHAASAEASDAYDSSSSSDAYDAYDAASSASYANCASAYDASSAR